MTTVYFTIEGLAIICFNPQKEQAEIAILRQGDHKLTISVMKEGESEPVKVYRHEEIPGEATIQVTSKESFFKGYQKISALNFDRSKGLDGINNERDLQWILDLEGDELHAEKLIALPKFPSDLALTKMFVSNALFYTAEMSKDKQIFLKRSDDPHNVHRLGLVGESLGAAVRAKEITLEVTGFPPLTLNDGSDYNIRVGNMEDYIPFVSDFPTYYDVLQPKGDLRFDVFPTEDSPRILNGSAYECYCVQCSKTDTIEGFKDLP